MKKNNLKKDLENAISENLLDQIDNKLESKPKSNFKDFSQLEPKEVDMQIKRVVLPQNYRLQVYLDADLGNKLALFMKKNKLSQSKAIKYILKEFFDN